MNLQRLMLTEQQLTATHREAMASLKRKKLAIIRRRLFTCIHCKEKYKLSEFGFIQTHHYTPPSGCNDGDYWNMCKLEVCHILCPCGTTNYIYTHPQRNILTNLLTSYGVEKKEIFASLWEQHGDGKPCKKVFPED